jgi:peptidoglycan hydrolase-like protein with peptidoglycan-binding domain
VVVQTPLQAAAVAMSNALTRNGYRLADQPIYKQFQTLAGTAADGFPGTTTMGLLQRALASMTPPLPMPPVPIYPWKAAPGYNGVNAPTSAQWYGTAPAPGPAPASGPPAPVQPYPGPGAWQTNSAYIARYQSALTYLSSVNPAYNTQGVDGQYGPNTVAAVKAFQADHGLTQDGEAGASTAAALDAAIASNAPAS